MATIKTPSQVVTAVSTVGVHATKRVIAEQGACILIGARISNGAQFQRAFPTITALNQWLAAGGDGSDIDILRVEPLATFVQ